MAKHPVKLIYASTPSGIVGCNGAIPWHVPEDLALFKQKTLFSTVLMGRKTFESLPPSIRPMPNRKNVVVSRNRELKIAGCHVIRNPSGYLYNSKDSVWVIGGGELYKDVAGLCSEVHHTEVYVDTPGNVSFNFDVKGWDVVEDTGVLTSRTGTKYRVRKYTVPLAMTLY